MITINDFNFKNQKALIRVDFNLPLDKNLEVTDTTRIEASRSTIIKVLEDGGSVVLISHLGKPKGKVVPGLSLQHIVRKVSEILGVAVEFIPDCIGNEVKKAVTNLQNGKVLLLENLRFYMGETEADSTFAEQLSKLGDIYVNDAFGVVHRNHASITTIVPFFEKKKCFGDLLVKEISHIEKIMEKGDKPITAILGGSKVSSKITIINNILGKIDHLIIGGGMVYTFIKAQGGKIGNSIYEQDKLELALDILKEATYKKVKVWIPTDVIAADAFNNLANKQEISVNNIPKGWAGLDVGTETLALFREVIIHSKTILWNGPVGVFEMPSFAKGTISIGNYVAEATQKGAFSLVGGGDSVAAVKQFGFENKVSYVSTGGGAMLESLEGKTLPGIAALLE